MTPQEYARRAAEAVLNEWKLSRRTQWAFSDPLEDVAAELEPFFIALASEVRAQQTRKDAEPCTPHGQ